jgi:hypothetical protein
MAALLHGCCSHSDTAELSMAVKVMKVGTVAAVAAMAAMPPWLRHTSFHEWLQQQAWRL